MQSPRAKHQGSITGHDCRDAGGRAPKVGALGDAGAVAEDSPVRRRRRRRPQGEGHGRPESIPASPPNNKSAPKGAFLLFDKDAGQMQYPRAKHKDLNPLMQPSQNRPTCEMEPNTL
jgi:hypothetical protein